MVEMQKDPMEPPRFKYAKYVVEEFLKDRINPFISGHSQNSILIFLVANKVMPCESFAKVVQFKWSDHQISFPHSEVRTIVQDYHSLL